ncbi:MAG: hypothetical protein IJT59_00720 [Desulfovibrionaceae bacterium]|nr:hypothetical protein [Desulfovibrionaceae bacterium]
MKNRQKSPDLLGYKTACDDFSADKAHLRLGLMSLWHQNHHKQSQVRKDALKIFFAGELPHPIKGCGFIRSVIYAILILTGVSTSPL